jgi:CPA1 family monovalent cation:H+ antiporter
MVVLAGWPPITAAAFGVLIAATDPVSVVATFKETGVGGRLRLLVEAESLFNDGTAAVGLGLVLAFAGGTSPTAAGIAWQAATTIGGGIGVGFVVARALLMLAGRTSEPMVEITLTTVIAYAAFLMAEHFGFSGVLSTLTAGLVAGNGPGRRQLSTAGREMLDTWWQVAAFFANSIVFLLIGMHETGQAYSTAALASVAGIAVVMLGRAAAVYPVAWAFSRTRMRVTPAHQHLLVWGGLRGALALALALGLPADLPGRDAVVTAAFAVVAFSVLVQGLTMTPLLRHFGEMPPRR